MSAHETNAPAAESDATLLAARRLLATVDAGRAACLSLAASYLPLRSAAALRESFQEAESSLWPEAAVERRFAIERLRRAPLRILWQAAANPVVEPLAAGVGGCGHGLGSSRGATRGGIRDFTRRTPRGTQGSAEKKRSPGFSSPRTSRRSPRENLDPNLCNHIEKSADRPLLCGARRSILLIESGRASIRRIATSTGVTR